jgi:hypothetical protein
LAVLGVDWIVIVVLLAVLLTRRLWVRRQPGAFRGAIRIVDGELPGLHRRWKRGSGRWLHDVLVWSKAPSLFRNELVAVADMAGEVRTGKPGEVKRLGRGPVIVPVMADSGACIEVAAPADSRERALGPFADGPVVSETSPARPHARP